MTWSVFVKLERLLFLGGVAYFTAFALAPEAFGSKGDEEGRAIAIGPNGHVYFTGAIGVHIYSHW